MAGPMAKMYGAATMAGKDEMNGRINPALEPDDDLPVAEAQRQNRITAAPHLPPGHLGPLTPAAVPGQGNTNF